MYLPYLEVQAFPPKHSAISFDSLNDLDEFIKVTNVGMTNHVKDYNGLVEVSHCMQRVALTLPDAGREQRTSFVFAVKMN